jgi:tripartite-type tricarboxylate transporter receptor subunit TctC
MKLPHRRQFLHLAAGAVALPAASQIARAQAYPARPITMIVPYPAGGQADTIPRIMLDRMKESLGQPIVIENVSGGGGTIGVGRVARAAPNGYLIGLGASQTNVNNGAVYSLPYDLYNDFEPIALLASSPVLIIGRKNLPANNLIELVAWLKANHEKVSQGHIGAGGGTHLCGVELQIKTGITWTLVPYRGVAPMMQDILGEQIDFTCAALGSSVAQVRAKQVKTFAVAAPRRLATLPDVPSVDEAGLPGFYISAWYGLWAPKGVTRDMVVKLNAAVVKALSDPAVRQRIADLGLELPPRDQQTPEYLAAYQKAEIEKWWPIIKAAGIKAE